ncbi:Nudix hydrolase 15, mitochondrial [Ancistrocladus abbreviatus]
MSGVDSCSQRLANLARQLRPYRNKASFSSISSNGNHNNINLSKQMNQILQGSKESIDSNQIAKSGGRPKRAAVLICIFEGDDGDLRVILTKRSSTLSSHSGEVALPGGKMDEGDIDDVATALREAQEEIGLDPSLVHVATVLDPFITKNDMAVVPVIGLLVDKNAFHPNQNAAEVELVFDVPLEMFLKLIQNENRRDEEREWKGQKYSLHFFDYEAENKKLVIYGFTAGVLIKAATIVYQRSPAFIEGMPEFWIKSR